ncbi:MAG: hypothetical protein QF535_15575 [Anaerolineales bacterium]|nr:hypothetical protein [Anaerolineales bacterium]
MTLKKPTLDTAAMNFAEKKPTETKQTTGNQVPAGDVRLTANISKAHHRKIKLAALHQDTTIGELLEQLIDKL